MSFRASPWITYDPPPTGPANTTMDTDHDVDMDAPQISTLREEDSPPPAPSPTRTGKFRVKLLVNEPKPGTKFITFNGETGEEAGGTSEGPEEDDVPEEDDEEDQLIDDEEEPVSRVAKRAQAKGKVTKRKASGRAGAPVSSKPLMTTFEVTPPGSLLARHSPSRDVSDVASIEASPMPVPVLSGPKKRAVPKGTTAAQRAPRKSNTRSKTTITIPPYIEQADASDGYTGTAPSSPIVPATLPPSPSPPSTSLPSASVAPPAPGLSSTSTPVSALDIPLPVYPLPTKPFHVQPPPKIGTGYAPLIPLDRTSKKPRHWRPAVREIRGIAGGRWFARAWVGAQDSELAPDPEKEKAAAASAAGGSASLTLPKLPALTLSGVSGKGGKGKALKSEVASTAASSRSASLAPEAGTPTPVTARAPPKKKSALSTTVIDLEPEPTRVDADVEMAVS